MLEDESGLTPLIGVIIVLTLTMAVGAIIAATVSGSPRPTLPLSTALHMTDGSNMNLSAEDDTFALYHEWGQPIGSPSESLEIAVNGDSTQATVDDWNGVTPDFDAGEQVTGTFSTALESQDLVTVVYKPRNLTLIEAIIQ